MRPNCLVGCFPLAKHLPLINVPLWLLTVQVMATPQYSVTAAMALPTGGVSNGPFIGAQRGRAPPNIRGSAPSKVRCCIGLISQQDAMPLAAIHCSVAAPCCKRPPLWPCLGKAHHRMWHCCSHNPTTCCRPHPCELCRTARWPPLTCSSGAAPRCKRPWKAARRAWQVSLRVFAAAAPDSLAQ